MNVADKIIEMGHDDVIIFDDPSYDSAFIGVSASNQAVYDYRKMIEYLMNTENITYEEASDFISYNISYFNGDEYPIIVYLYDEEGE